MIARLTGVLVELDDNSALVEVGGVGYQVLLPAYCTGELAGHLQEQVTLHTLYYLQLERNRAVPYLVGFPRPQDREFFEKFTTVAGVGPKMAAKALVRPIAQIAAAIDAGDVAALVALPSIGSQKAKQIIAKLQGKVTTFALARPAEGAPASPATEALEEARLVLAQLQLSQKESEELLQHALSVLGEEATTEALVNEALKHRGSKL